MGWILQGRGFEPARGLGRWPTWATVLVRYTSSDREALLKVVGCALLEVCFDLDAHRARGALDKGARVGRHAFGDGLADILGQPVVLGDVLEAVCSRARMQKQGKGSSGRADAWLGGCVIYGLSSKSLCQSIRLPTHSPSGSSSDSPHDSPGPQSTSSQSTPPACTKMQLVSLTQSSMLS